MMKFGARAAQPAHQRNASREGRHILVVDDDPAVLRLVARVLEQVGHKVETATDGRRAIDRLNQPPVDLVLLDWRLPQATGLDVLRALRRKPGWEKTPVLMMTGSGDADDKVAGLSAGAVDYVTKPFHWAELVARVEAHLRARTLEEDLARANIDLQAAADRKEHLEARLQDTTAQTAELVLGLVEVYDPALGTHCRRVARIAREAGKLLGLDRERMRTLDFAARLMKVGMLGLPRELLWADERTLDTPGRRLVRRHPSLGAEFLAPIPGLRETAALVRSHMERFDGTGYPDALAGERIPLECRLIAAARRFDRLNSAEHPFDDTLEELRSRAGSELGPHSVAAVTQVALSERDAMVTPRQLLPDELHAGMTVTDDVHADDGRLLLGYGTELSPMLIARLKTLWSRGHLQNPVGVHGG